MSLRKPNSVFNPVSRRFEPAPTPVKTLDAALEEAIHYVKHHKMSERFALHHVVEKYELTATDEVAVGDKLNFWHGWMIEQGLLKKAVAA
jgi:hypothetical protein